jgi:hypothetical protein
MNRAYYIILLMTFAGIKLAAQYNYLAYDQFFFRFDQPSPKNNTALDQRTLNSTGNYSGAVFHFGVGNTTAFSIGAGLSNIHYEKQWLGIFPEKDQFGVVRIKGNIKYWSFPVSLRLMSYSTKRYGCRGPLRTFWQFGMNISYIPSFAGKHTYSLKTFAGADSSLYVTNLNSNEQSFQHSILIGLSNRLYLLKSRILMEVQPCFGIGSGYFRENGTKFNNLSYGIRLQIGFRARMPRIQIWRETNKDYTDKKQELQKKQQEIQQQLNKPQ